MRSTIHSQRIIFSCFDARHKLRTHSYRQKYVGQRSATGEKCTGLGYRRKNVVHGSDTGEAMLLPAQLQSKKCCTRLSSSRKNVVHGSAPVEKMLYTAQLQSKKCCTRLSYSRKNVVHGSDTGEKMLYTAQLQARKFCTGLARHPSVPHVALQDFFARCYVCAACDAHQSIKKKKDELRMHHDTHQLKPGLFGFESLHHKLMESQSEMRWSLAGEETEV